MYLKSSVLMGSLSLFKYLCWIQYREHRVWILYDQDCRFLVLVWSRLFRDLFFEAFASYLYYIIEWKKTNGMITYRKDCPCLQGCCCWSPCSFGCWLCPLLRDSSFGELGMCCWLASKGISELVDGQLVVENNRCMQLKVRLPLADSRCFWEILLCWWWV